MVLEIFSRRRQKLSSNEICRMLFESIKKYRYYSLAGINLQVITEEQRASMYSITILQHSIN